MRRQCRLTLTSTAAPATRSAVTARPSAVGRAAPMVSGTPRSPPRSIPAPVPPLPARPALAAQADLAPRAIELGYPRLGQRTRGFFGKAESRHPASFAVPLLDIVVDVHVPVPNGDLIGETRQSLAGLVGNELVAVDQ